MRGWRRPRRWSTPSAVRWIDTTARTLRRPPQVQRQTSSPKVRAWRVAQSRRGRFGFGAATGDPPKATVRAENLTPEEAAGVETLLAHERGLDNLSNKIPDLPKNAKRIEAGKKVLEGREED